MNSFECQTSKDDELSVIFSDAMDWQSMPTNSDEIVVYPVRGGHQSGSSQIKVKNIVDSTWDKTFQWGNLVATHFKGQYFAYALKVPGKPEGMVRVIRDGYPDRIILKGFRGFVRDLSFAFHEKRILVAAVDEYGYVLVFEIVGSSPSLVLQVNPDGITTSSDNHRIVWCQYVPESPNSFDESSNGIRNDSEDHALLLAASHDCRLEVWHLGHVNGTVSYQTVNSGTTEVAVFDEAVVDIAFSPDSTAFAVASLDGCVRFFLVNTTKEEPKLLHKWVPHDGKRLSSISFLDNMNHPNIKECPLWKWVVTSAENNTEFKLWSCEEWKCHQTIRFKSSDSAPIVQKMTVDASASFLLVSDIHRKVLYVMHIEQTPIPSLKDDGVETIVCKVSSITQLLLPFSAISLAIREATLKLRGGPIDDFEGEERSNRVSLKMYVVQPKSLQKCRVTFELGTSVPLGEGFDPSCSTINTTSDYESTASSRVTTASTYLSLLTPEAFVSPAKTGSNSFGQESTTGGAPSATPGSMPLPPVTPNEILALSSPRRPSPDTVSSSAMTPPPKRNGVQSGGSSPSREVEEILCTRPTTEETESDGSNSAPSGPFQDAVAAYPPSLSPAFIRAGSAISNKDCASPAMDKPQNKPVEDPLRIFTEAVQNPAAPLSAPSIPGQMNGSLLELFQEVLTVNSAPQQPSWPTSLPSHNIQPVQRVPKEQDILLSQQMQTMQQTLNQLVQLVSAQQSEQQQLKNEVGLLRSELSRVESNATAQPSWMPQLESTFSGYFDRQQKKLDEVASPTKTQQTITKLQSTIRSEFENKASTLEQRSVDFIRKELQSVIAGEMNKMEPILKTSMMQMLSHLSQNKSVIDSYGRATSEAAVLAMNRACKDTVAQQLLPTLERSFHTLFAQLHDTFSKGINEFVRNIESNLERHRRQQDKEANAQLGTTMEKMRHALEGVRESISNDTKAELRKNSAEFPERVRALLAPMIQAEMQQAAKEQKLCLDGALLAVQQAAQVQTNRAVTPVLPSAPALQGLLKQLVREGRWSEAFQKSLSVADLNMVLFVCRLVDSKQLFSTVPCVLPQAVLLSLIQQLSADLTMSTDIKLDYLQEAILAVDFQDPVSKEHGPNVIAALIRQLHGLLGSQPAGGPMTRQLRMLLLTAQSLQKGQ